MTDIAERYEGYARAVLRIADVDRRRLVLEPRPPGECHGTFPFEGTAHVLTAFDPGPRRLGTGENARRQDALVAGLPAGLPRWKAVTGAPDGSRRESSIVVVGLTDDRARETAGRWGQDAIFRWTPDAWSILPCGDGEPVHLGWSLTAT